MQFVRVATLAVVALPIGIALVFWWAGFAPFPTNPVLLASYQEAGDCTVQADNNWANCSPSSPRTNPEGSEPYFRLFPGTSKPTRSLLGAGYGQWGVEGFNGCWDEGCSRIWHEPDIGMLRWKVYNDTEVPHFGLGRPNWVAVIVSSTAGVRAADAYTTYGACMYRKPVDTGTYWYQCLRIEPEKPWVVGAIRTP